jgi:hypothetical protein
VPGTLSNPISMGFGFPAGAAAIKAAGGMVGADGMTDEERAEAERKAQAMQTQAESNAKDESSSVAAINAREGYNPTTPGTQDPAMRGLNMSGMTSVFGPDGSQIGWMGGGPSMPNLQPGMPGYVPPTPLTGPLGAGLHPTDNLGISQDSYGMPINTSGTNWMGETFGNRFNNPYLNFPGNRIGQGAAFPVLGNPGGSSNVIDEEERRKRSMASTKRTPSLFQTPQQLPNWIPSLSGTEPITNSPVVPERYNSFIGNPHEFVDTVYNHAGMPNSVSNLTPDMLNHNVPLSVWTKDNTIIKSGSVPEFQELLQYSSSNKQYLNQGKVQNPTIVPFKEWKQQTEL